MAKEPEASAEAASLSGSAPQAPFLRVRSRLSWWKGAGAPEWILQLLQGGVQWPQAAKMPKNGGGLQHKSQEEEEKAERVLDDYLKAGAVTQVPIPQDRPWPVFFAKKTVCFFLCLGL